MMRYRLQAATPFLGMLLLTTLAAGCGSPGGTKGPDSPGSEIQQKQSPARPKAAQENDPGAAPKGVPNQVVIDNFTFNPRTLTVAAGTKVTWVNHDDVPHTATSTRKPRLIDSGTLDTDDKFEHVFKTPGTYEYFCAVHPHMTGRIIVK
jgi:plastocyanin